VSRPAVTTTSPVDYRESSASNDLGCTHLQATIEPRWPILTSDVWQFQSRAPFRLRLKRCTQLGLSPPQESREQWLSQSSANVTVLRIRPPWVVVAPTSWNQAIPKQIRSFSSQAKNFAAETPLFENAGNSTTLRRIEIPSSCVDERTNCDGLLVGSQEQDRAL